MDHQRLGDEETPQESSKRKGHDHCPFCRDAEGRDSIIIPKPGLGVRAVFLGSGQLSIVVVNPTGCLPILVRSSASGHSRFYVKDVDPMARIARHPLFGCRLAFSDSGPEVPP